MKDATRPAIFKWRQTAPELILCAVRWYLRYSLSLRDVEELFAERGLEADHTTIWPRPQEDPHHIGAREKKETSSSLSVGVSAILFAGFIVRMIQLESISGRLSLGCDLKLSEHDPPRLKKI